MISVTTYPKAGKCSDWMNFDDLSIMVKVPPSVLLNLPGFFYGM